MSRTKIISLLLVNWRGVFYERYLLDSNVTALEGGNGAGKTTVMIAAYVALLPDISRLRFTNVGESGAKGGDRGIWGRLGDAARPSYTALELRRADGSRIIAGVRLLKKGEPSVEATPFIIESLHDDVSLQELFLVQDGDEEHVPELAELRQGVEGAGATLQVFRAVKDYFAALFERGITPMRLVGEEDRNKFNEMLRTSMTGGISKTLTQELRSFVLKKESGLADTLSLMRANLDACRRSRGEVSDARRLQREISGVYDAGTAFFGTQVLSVRARAHERREALLRAKENLSAVTRGHVELETSVAAHKARQEQVQTRQRDARIALEAAKHAEERRRKAELLRDELASRDEELAELAKNAELAKHVMDACDEERTAWQTARDSAQEAYDRAAGGLAKLQDGLDELHRRARDYRQLQRSLEQARQALASPELGLGDCAVTLARIKAESEELDSERARLERETQSLTVRREEYERVRSALTELDELVDVEAPEQDSGPHQTARLLLAELDRRESTQGRLGDLEQERTDLGARIARQEAARERAEKLGIATGALGAADSLAARLEQTEAQWGEDEERARFYDGLAAKHEREHGAVTVETEALELRTARYASASKAATHLAESLKLSAIRTTQDLENAEAALTDRHSAHVQSRIDLERSREAALREVSELETGGGALSSELLRLRDVVGGELVAGRFEELAASDAARLEASLGPLAQAIIVDDVAEAAATLAAEKEPPRHTVWLVAAGTPLESLAAATDSDASCVVVVDGMATRVSPVPSNPTLGRAARGEATDRARAQAASLAEDLEESARGKLQLATLHKDFGILRDAFDSYLAGDPAPARDSLRQKSATLLTEVTDAREQASAARERAAGLRGEVDALRGILSEGALLEPPDYRAQLDSVDALITRATHTSGLLLAAQSPRNTVSLLLDVLRQEPPDEADVEQFRGRIKACEERRDALFGIRDVLTEAMANRHAIEWHDAEELLESRTSLVPALEEQHLQAREATAEASRSVANAEQEWAGATKVWQAADARHAASLAMRERLALDLSELGPDRERGEDTSADVKRRLLSLDKELLEAVESGARDRERLERSEHRLAEAGATVKNEILASEPSQKSWNELRDACEDADLLSGLLTDGENANRTSRTAEQLVAQAAGKRDLLVDRLNQARGGEELLALVQAIPSGIEIGGESEQLRVWVSLREWMRQRVPAQISQEPDPLRALERLREHLSALESRLGNQEGDLRSASEDVARGVDVQVRRARWQVARLNEHLENIQFGTISGIRVQMSRVERMEQILRALRDGQAQELLFQASLPFEDALSEIFTRYGGGRGGGQRLLDYREYLELGVEIRRQSGDRWEEASPTRLSTGEAIGVGAALMMVVLTEWERDANLLRSQKLGGSLRFLFLDEANRLSKDNLGVLFELCKSLELQLLIAAPEVAHAGDNTTYRLVRRVLEGGGEEVLVSGRKAAAASEASPAAIEAATEAGAAATGAGTEDTDEAVPASSDETAT